MLPKYFPHLAKSSRTKSYLYLNLLSKKLRIIESLLYLFKSNPRTGENSSHSDSTPSEISSVNEDTYGVRKIYVDSVTSTAEQEVQIIYQPRLESSATEQCK